MTTLLVPIKAVDSAKSRLAGRLSAAQRETLCMDMLAHVVQAGQASAVTRTVLLSACPTISGWARAHGVEVVVDPPAADSLATVVDHGISHIRQRDAGPILVLMGDLPTVAAKELRRMTDALDQADVVLAPDVAEAGTNGLAFAADVRLPTCFGRADSFHAHRARCRSLGLRIAEVRSAGLAFDLDTGSDLDAYLRLTSRASATS